MAKGGHHLSHVFSEEGEDPFGVCVQQALAVPNGHRVPWQGAFVEDLSMGLFGPSAKVATKGLLIPECQLCPLLLPDCLQLVGGEVNLLTHLLPPLLHVRGLSGKGLEEGGCFLGPSLLGEEVFLCGSEVLWGGVLCEVAGGPFELLD